MTHLSAAHLSFAAALLLLCFGCVACGGEDNTATTPDQEMGGGGADMTDGPLRCVSNEVLNPETGRCEPIFMPGLDMGADAGVDAIMTPDMTDPAEMDPVDDMIVTPPDEGVPCQDTVVYRDEDQDDYGVDDPASNLTVCLAEGAEHPGYSRRAGDCDDQDSFRNPGQLELCDAIDNDCDGVLNQGIVCEFYAHSPDKLYSIDPFKKTIREEGSARPAMNTTLLDIDTHPDGRLFGISSSALYVYEFKFGQWVWTNVGSLQSNLQGANGLAIDRRGDGFATARNQLYKISLDSARADAPNTLTPPDSNTMVNSSGDCVISKGDVLYMTSKGAQGSTQNDDLVRIDRLNNSTTMVGRTNHRNIFGLTSAWGLLFGVTLDGQLIEIDINTGVSTLIQTFPGVGFYGAASSPSR